MESAETHAWRTAGATPQLARCCAWLQANSTSRGIREPACCTSSRTSGSQLPKRAGASRSLAVASNNACSSKRTPLASLVLARGFHGATGPWSRRPTASGPG